MLTPISDAWTGTGHDEISRLSKLTCTLRKPYCIFGLVVWGKATAKHHNANPFQNIYCDTTLSLY